MKDPKVIWFDGKLIKFADAKIHILSHALHYGSGVFEGIRAYKTVAGTAIFRLNDHIDRLFRSALTIGIKIPYSKKSIGAAIKKVVAQNGFTECYIRPIVFYGEGQMALAPRGAKIHIAIAAWPWGAYLGKHKTLSVGVSRYVRFHPKSVVPGAKITGLYATSVLATLDARGRGFDEAILLDHAGFVAEGPGENIFIVKKGKLFTPKSPAILPGITRESVMYIAKALRISVSEKKISLKVLLNADEAFLTGTAAEIASIGRVNKKILGNGKGGAVTTLIRSAYLSAARGKKPKYKNWLAVV